jgi:hypothetical protein
MAKRNLAKVDSKPAHRAGADRLSGLHAAIGVLNLSPEGVQALVAELESQYERRVNVTIYNFYGPTKFTGDANMANVKNTGPIGAQAIGSHARADSRGNVTQRLTPEKAAPIAALLKELQQLLAGVQLANPAPLENTRQELDTAIRATEQEDAGAATDAWNKVKTWIGGALDIGAFAAATATKIGALVEKIGTLFS